MILLRCAIFLQISLMLAHGQSTHQSLQSNVADKPDAMIARFYHEILARQPVGIPTSADMKAIAPYLSKTLLHRIDLARACEVDYYRLHKNPNVKPEIEWLEFGIFSGGVDKARPSAFHIEKIQVEKNGSLRANVRLTLQDNPSDKWTWRTTIIVAQEDDHFVIDDIVFWKDIDLHTDLRLSELLSAGCEGSHWIGYGSQRVEPKQQR